MKFNGVSGICFKSAVDFIFMDIEKEDYPYARKRRNLPGASAIGSISPRSHFYSNMESIR
jgi:hypothetical protein